MARLLARSWPSPLCNGFGVWMAKQVHAKSGLHTIAHTHYIAAVMYRQLSGRLSSRQNISKVFQRSLTSYATHDPLLDRALHIQIDMPSALKRGAQWLQDWMQRPCIICRSSPLPEQRGMRCCLWAYALSVFACRVKRGGFCSSSAGCRECGPLAGAAPGQEAQEVQEGGEQ